MNWTDLSSAPAPGTLVARVSTLSGAQAMTVTTDRGDFPLLLVVTEDGIKGYVNACPHQFLPLDYRSPRLLSQNGTRLMCSAHGAMFDATTGQGVAGEGLGCQLSTVPLRESNGQVFIDG
jgi:nitrite reductase/ring-hydroxylating ferredoxin subunit